MAIVFAKAERPTVTRARKVNPYLNDVKELAKDFDQTVSVELPYKTDDHIAAVNSLVQQMQAAGRELGVSVKKVVSEPKAGKVTVSFWATTAIKRPRVSAE